MANISTDFSTWSGTAASNQPDSGDTATVQADLQAIQAALRTIFPSVNAAVTPTHTELNYVDGVTSAIQTQLNAKAASGANGDITSLTACTSITAGTVTVATGDLVYVQDVSAADVLKVVTAQSIADLGSSLATNYRLTLSGGSLLLAPYNGNKLTINGVLETIPDAGVTLAATALTAGHYYIYAYMSGATMTLEASTTARATSTSAGNKGNQIKSGNNTRTLVGAAYSTAAAFSDTDTNRLVISWANRRNISGRSRFTANRTTTSTSPVEVNSETRINFLTWDDEAIQSCANGSASNSTAFQDTRMAIGWDGATVFGGLSRQANTTATSINSLAATSVAYAGQLTEAAIHYVTILGAVSANTGTYIGGADNADRCEINVMIRG